MIRLVGKRLLEIVPTLLILSVIIFLLQRLLPGDPALALAGDNADDMLIAQIRRQYGLDRPLPLQYLGWMGGVLQGDLGMSLRLGRPVATLILDRLPITLQLAVMAMVIALVTGITAGIVAAVKKRTPWDYAATTVAIAGISVPNFWLGTMMILLFSVHLNWLPASGYISPLVDPIGSLQRMIMPAVVLGTAISGVMMRHTRSAMLQALESDYVRTARAKGLFERVIIVRHAMRNALTPIITLGALEFGGLLGGAVLTEHIFGIPGFGKLIVDAVFNRDYAVVQGVVLVTGLIYVFMSLLADIGYILANPRLRNK